jgi:hypothetical protein
MKTTIEPLFSNGTAHMSWIAMNCDRCIKQSTYNPKTDEYTAFRCSIDRDIQMQAAGLREVNVRSLEVVKNKHCPNIQMQHKPPKRRKLKGQAEMF